MSEPKPLTDEEVAYLKRPLTDDERAATRGMPGHISEGFLRRKRAGEIAQQRADTLQGKYAEILEGLAGILNDMEPKP